LSSRKLIKKLKKKNPKLNNSELESIVNIFLADISDALKNQKNIEIRGLGRWYFKKLKENFNARNPATNELIYKPERIKVRFKSSKLLNKIINE
jgi:nucleoid DNA-binding protein|tara:strand:- start:15 stop:296 length:282 start_codon:yes stop_codon:yes gene_type:complete